MKTCARYPKFWMKDTGFSHGTLSPATIMLISVSIAKSISVLLSLFSGVVRYYTFAVLPFGSAYFCFTKLMRLLVRRWRSMGHTSFIYLDDSFGSQPDKCSATAASLIQRKELSSSGLLCNEEKSHWTLVQIGEWLDSISMSFRIREKKVSKLKGLLDSAIQAGYSSFRELARITGTISPVALAVGPIFVFWPGRCTSPLKPGQHETTPFIFLPVFYSSSNFGTATSIASTVIL